MSKSNKTSVADALKVIADALTGGDKKEVKKEADTPKSFYAVYVETRQAPIDARTGQYINDATAQEAYYNLYPQYRPKPWSIAAISVAPRYTVAIETGKEDEALDSINKAVQGLKLLNAPSVAQYGDKYTYHVFKVTPHTVN